MATRKQVILFGPIPRDVTDTLILKRDYTHRIGAPLSILAVASLAMKNGYDVKIVSGAESNYLDRLEQLLKNDTLCLGISSMTGSQINQGLKISRYFREHFPGRPIIWGGFHPSILPEQTILSPYVDFVIRGYGEYPFLKLLQAIELDRGYESVPNLTFILSGTIIHTPEAEIEKLEMYPPLPYELLDLPLFLTKELGERTLAYISSRGCVNHCRFCADRTVYKGRWNALPAERVIEDITYLKQTYNIDSIRIYDSNFFIDEQRVAKICRGLLERNLKISWGRANGSIELLNRYSEETWELMVASGCSTLLVGAESGYDIALKRINKRANLEDLNKFIALSNSYQIGVIYSFMIGIPIDLKDPVEQRRHFMKELSLTLNLIERINEESKGPVQTLPFRFTVYPGNPIYDECKEAGWPEPKSLEEWSNITLDSSPTPWLTSEEISLLDAAIRLVIRASPTLRAGRTQV